MMQASSRQIEARSHYCAIDFLKVFAAQIIILHHSVSYGQLAEQLRLVTPELVGFLYDYGRYAVQIFLVMAGYLAAQSLGKMGITNPSQSRAMQVMQLALRRYLRLLGPYLVALLITILCAAIARHWLSDEYVGQAETIPQLLAHVFLLHGLLGYESISAGAWYIAIDWQLYTSLAILLAAFPGRGKQITILLLLMLLSLFYFNRNTAFENYFIYFIGSYGLGAIAYWASDRRIRKLFLVVGLVIAASAIHSVWLRNYVALATAIMLLYAGQWTCAAQVHGGHLMHGVMRCLQWASARSYCAFLIHFALILLANTAWVALHLQGFVAALGLLGLVSLLSWLAADGLYCWVELPAGRFRPRILFPST
ncbi:MAG: acyltransferase family protein [Polynucleobacter sp.]|nr:acyltransferase family protein [Polynucleobacter sp.]